MNEPPRKRPRFGRAAAGQDRLSPPEGAHTESGASAAAASSPELKPDVDDLFAIRATDRPDRIHPLYAAECGTKVAEKVEVTAVKMTGYSQFFLFGLAQKERTARGNQRINMTKKEVRFAISKLEATVLSELKRTGAGESRKKQDRDYFIRPVNESDVEPHEAFLIGQDGLFVRQDLQDDKQPILKNGNILGIYAGAYLRNDTELDHHTKMHKGALEVDRYRIEIPGTADAPKVSVSGVEGASSMAFANTALTIKSQYDESRINAVFVAFEVELTDKNGQPRKELVTAIVGLDNLTGHVCVDYGPGFPQQIREEILRAGHARKEDRANENRADPGAADLKDVLPRVYADRHPSRLWRETGVVPDSEDEGDVDCDGGRQPPPPDAVLSEERRSPGEKILYVADSEDDDADVPANGVRYQRAGPAPVSRSFERPPRSRGNDHTR